MVKTMNWLNVDLSFRYMCIYIQLNCLDMIFNCLNTKSSRKYKAFLNIYLCFDVCFMFSHTEISPWEKRKTTRQTEQYKKKMVLHIILLIYWNNSDLVNKLHFNQFSSHTHTSNIYTTLEWVLWMENMMTSIQ